MWHTAVSPLNSHLKKPRTSKPAEAEHFPAVVQPCCGSAVMRFLWREVLIDYRGRAKGNHLFFFPFFFNTWPTVAAWLGAALQLSAMFNLSLQVQLFSAGWSLEKVEMCISSARPRLMSYYLLCFVGGGVRGCNASLKLWSFLVQSRDLLVDSH